MSKTIVLLLCLPGQTYVGPEKPPAPWPYKTVSAATYNDLAAYGFPDATVSFRQLVLWRDHGLRRANDAYRAERVLSRLTPLFGKNREAMRRVAHETENAQNMVYYWNKLYSLRAEFQPDRNNLHGFFSHVTGGGGHGAWEQGWHPPIWDGKGTPPKFKTPWPKKKKDDPTKDK